MNIHGHVACDWYTRRRWDRIPGDRRAAVEESIPADHALHLTHGGDWYTARLFAADGELVAQRRASTVLYAALVVIDAPSAA